MTAGSHATWSPKDERVCAICGQPLRITKDTLWIHTNDLTGEHTSSHTSCGPPWETALTPNGRWGSPLPARTHDPTPAADSGSLHADRVPQRESLVATGPAAGTSPPRKGPT